MNTITKTAQARTTNRVERPVGRHWTLTSVVHDPRRGSYAFALDDDGDTGFIPRPVVRQYNITEADVGAGFHAPVRPAAVSAGEGAAPQIISPLTFDGGAQEVTIEVSAEQCRDYDAEIDALLDKLEDQDDARKELSSIREQLKTVLASVTNSIEHVNRVESILDGHLDWVAKEYPD